VRDARRRPRGAGPRAHREGVGARGVPGPDPTRAHGAPGDRVRRRRHREHGGGRPRVGVRRSAPEARRAARGARRPRRGRDSRGRGVRDRVRPRRPASVEAPQQGRRRRQGHVPRARLTAREAPRRAASLYLRHTDRVSTRPVDVVDYYAELGVEPTASQAEIASTYRSLVKTLHPDARPTDPAAADGSRGVPAAYGTRGEAGRRRAYDGRRARGLAPVAAAERTVAPAPAAAPPSRRGARWAIAGGIACIVAGLAAAGLIISLQRHDAELRDRGTPATATIVLQGTERRRPVPTAPGP